MRRKYWIASGAAVLLLAAAHLAYWRIADVRLRQAIQTSVSALRAQGWELGSDALRDGGWPLAATVTLPNVTLRHDAATVPGLVDLAAPSVTLALPLLHPAEPRLELGSPWHARVAAVPDMILDGKAMTLTAQLSSRGSRPLAFRGRDLGLGPADGAWRSRIGQLKLDGEMDPPAGGEAVPIGRFVLDAEAITLPPLIKWPLGPNVASLFLQGGVHGPFPPTGKITPWAKAWRDGGGSLDVSRGVLAIGPLTVSISAAIRLDDQLQPMGTANAHIIGYGETLDRLASNGVMTRSAATAAKAILSLMAGVGDGDDAPSVDVPLTLQYRTLSMRQVPIIRVPELDWPLDH